MTEEEITRGSMVPKPIATTPRSFISSKRIVEFESNKSKPSFFLTNKAQAETTVVRKTDTKIISEQSLENDEYNLNLEASALHEAVKFEMRNGRPPSLLDLEEFLTSEEISMIQDDLDYIYGKGWNKQTATIPEMELAEVAA